MFHDRAKIFVRGGAGGDGAVSFRREAHVPKGGPDGGDGGRGGNVELVCDDSRRDLSEFHRGAHFKARRGGHGEGNQRHGASADTLEVRVPPGTVAEDEHGSRWDLVRPGQRATVAQGGSGGRGNKSFAHSTRQTPRMAERGLPGDEGWIELRLKLLADAGLVGLPNAGKSSLLARLTAARPKVAGLSVHHDRPGAGDDRGRRPPAGDRGHPGLIEGASEGAGLGHEFLAHVERCRLLVHVLDLAPLDGSDPVENHATVEAELREHGGGLAELPRILCLSKADLVEPERAAEVAREFGDALVTSAATGQGLDELRRAIVQAVPAADEEPEAGEVAATHRVYRPGVDEAFTVERTDAGGFRVQGVRLERLFARHDLGNEEALRYLEDRLRSMGVIKALESAGFEPGDDVEIAGTVFELDPG